MPGLIHLEKTLGEKNISTCRFDFSGSGESEGSKLLSVKQQHMDLDSVIRYLRDYKHIFLLGHSLGALPVLLCANNPQVAGIITVNGFFQGKVIRRDFRNTLWMLKLLRFLVKRISDEWSYLEKNCKGELIKKPTLLITTTHDTVIDYRQTMEFGNRLKAKHTTEVLPLLNHGIDSDHDADLVTQSITSWLDQFGGGR